MTRGIQLIVALAWLLWAVPAPASAAPVFNLLPPDDIVALPGETVGWGYEILNDFDDVWLVFSSLSTGGFQHGSGTEIFDFPIVAPQSSLSQPYGPDLGLYSFTWSSSAPAGFVNAGNFIVAADLYDGDPFTRSPLSTIEFTVPYSTSIAKPPAPVPEPSTVVLLVSGAAGLFTARQVQRRKSR